MSKTYTRKVHQAVIKKRENAIEKAKEEEARKEEEEAKSWAVGAKTPSKYDLKLEKERAKALRKEELRLQYEKEMMEESSD